MTSPTSAPSSTSPPTAARTVTTQLCTTVASTLWLTHLAMKAQSLRTCMTATIWESRSDSPTQRCCRSSWPLAPSSSPTFWGSFVTVASWGEVWVAGCLFESPSFLCLVVISSSFSTCLSFSSCSIFLCLCLFLSVSVSLSLSFYFFFSLSLSFFLSLLKCLLFLCLLILLSFTAFIRNSTNSLLVLSLNLLISFVSCYLSLSLSLSLSPLPLSLSTLPLCSPQHLWPISAIHCFSFCFIYLLFWPALSLCTSICLSVTSLPHSVCEVVIAKVWTLVWLPVDCAHWMCLLTTRLFDRWGEL